MRGKGFEEGITCGQGEAVDVLKAGERRSPILGRRPTRGKRRIQSHRRFHRREGLESGDWMRGDGGYLSEKPPLLYVAVTLHPSSSQAFKAAACDSLANWRNHG